MKLHSAAPTTANVFTGYGEGYVLVNGRRIESTVVVTPEQVWTDWSATTFEALKPEDFSALLALDREVILLGTGARLRFPAPQLLRGLIESGLGVEVMDVPAACRT